MVFTDEVIKGIVQRDERIYTQFYLEYANKLALFIDSFIQSKEDAKDLAYDFMLEIPNLIRLKYKDIGNHRGFVPWMYRIAQNKAKNYLIRKNRFPTTSFDENADFEIGMIHRIMDFRFEDLKCILKPDAYRILLLNRRHGYSVHQIAEIMSLTEDQVKKRLALAYRKAERFLRDLYDL